MVEEHYVVMILDDELDYDDHTITIGGEEFEISDLTDDQRDHIASAMEALALLIRRGE